MARAARSPRARSAAPTASAPAATAVCCFEVMARGGAKRTPPVVRQIGVSPVASPSSTKHPAPSTLHQAPCTKHPAPSTQHHQPPATSHQQPGEYPPFIRLLPLDRPEDDCYDP